MKTAYQRLQEELLAAPRSWLITGVAGFIGSNLAEALLRLKQRVVGLDDFSTGRETNLQEVERLVGPDLWANFSGLRGTITDAGACRAAFAEPIDYVLHEAALCSVPLSIEQPLKTHDNNVTGHLNMLLAAREAKAKRFVYASSSAAYGDCPDLPCLEHRIGRCLSPYALSKRVNELNSDLFGRAYGTECVGLRYFNVFGPRQDPNGSYAAVIPNWFNAMLRGKAPYINGDGEQTRDFCFVANVVQANLLAATGPWRQNESNIYNVGTGQRTSLNELFAMLKSIVANRHSQSRDLQPVRHAPLRGEVRHSFADSELIRTRLGYVPTHDLDRGLEASMEFYERIAEA